MLPLHLKYTVVPLFWISVSKYTLFGHHCSIGWSCVISIHQTGWGHFSDICFIHKELKSNVLKLSCFLGSSKTRPVRCAMRIYACFSMWKLREWDWIPRREGFSHSPKRGNNSVPLPTKTSQLVITYKWERSAFECIWGWTAWSYHRGALAPKHKWMERAQCIGETEERCAVNRGKIEETFAWDKGGWILG